MTEKGSPLNREPNSPSPVQSVAPAPNAGGGVVRCPHCGSTRICRRSRPLVFNAIACVVTLLLTPVICAMALVFLISCLLLPITTAIAAVGRNRCRDCRYRFTPGDRGDGTASSFRFPWAFHAANIVVLLLLCLVGPHIMRVRAGAGKLPDIMMSTGLFFMLGLLLWGSLLCHLIAYRVLRRRLANRVIWAVLFLVPGAVAGGYIFHGSSPRLRMQSLLVYTRLAPLPVSATGVKYYSWSSPFSGEDFVRFTAEPNDIERFLADSPALQGQEPERYSAQRMRLKYPTDAQGHTIYLMDANEYIDPDPTTPSWYKQEIRGPARKYHVQPPKYQFPGEVLVDDETHTVYIYLCFS